MSVFRRHSNAANQPSSSNASVSRSSTAPSRRAVGSNNPYADLAGLSLDDTGTPPPPDYQTALRHSVQGYPSQQQQQPASQQQQQYRPPQGAPPPRQPSQAQQQYHPPQGPPPARQQTRPVATPQAGPAAGVQRRSSVEDPLASLGKYDLVVLCDDSPSMVEWWDQTQTALMGLVTHSIKYDKDGIDLYWLNDTNHLENITEPSTVAEAFQTVVPTGSTPSGYLLDEILRPYIEKVEDAKTTRERVKPMILLVITDGRADDSDQVKDCLVEMAQRLDDVRAPPYQLGVQFIQVGDDDDASAFLQELDDDLKGNANVRDIVDTTPYEGQQLSSDFILKALLGSVVKRLDGQRLEGSSSPRLI